MFDYLNEIKIRELSSNEVLYVRHLKRYLTNGFIAGGFASFVSGKTNHFTDVDFFNPFLQINSSCQREFYLTLNHFNSSVDKDFCQFSQEEKIYASSNQKLRTVKNFKLYQLILYNYSNPLGFDIESIHFKIHFMYCVLADFDIFQAKTGIFYFNEKFYLIEMKNAMYKENDYLKITSERIEKYLSRMEIKCPFLLKMQELKQIHKDIQEEQDITNEMKNQQAKQKIIRKRRIINNRIIFN